MRASKWNRSLVKLFSLKRSLLLLITLGTIISWILFRFSSINRKDDPLPQSFLLSNPLQVNFKCDCSPESSSAEIRPLLINQSDRDGSYINITITPTATTIPAVLLVADGAKSRGSKPIAEILEYMNIRYKTLPSIKFASLINSIKKKRFDLFIFESLHSISHLNQSSQHLIWHHCDQFHVPLIVFFQNRSINQSLISNIDSSNRLSHLLFKLSSQSIPKSDVESIFIPDRSQKVLKIVKSNILIRTLPSTSFWNVFSSHDSTNSSSSFSSFIPLSEIIFKDKRSATKFSIHKSPSVLFDKGTSDRVPKCLFANPVNFWLHRLIFVDCVNFLLGSSHRPDLLDRFLLIDIDDIFVGQKGTRLRFEDVQELLLFQQRMSSMVKGFRLNLGFSGKFFHKGFDEEDFGDDALVAYGQNFWWFCHMWAHQQPHMFSNTSSLEVQMRLNQLFATQHKLPVNSGYAVAPHHSGVYPVHDPLYDAWKHVWGVNVTSTEEYPHLRPARLRRGFVYKDIKVLPRQTCGLYTHTVKIEEYPGGRVKLDRSIFGGELFFQFIFNKINIFMTHMSNYGNDRLAPYAFESVVKMLTCYTNLKLFTKNPVELGNFYFKVHPEQVTPLWKNPCEDRRLLEIWPDQERCHRFPSLLIVGPQRSGSSALHSFLQIHPGVKSNLPSKENFEELQFFNSRNYLLGINWYLQHFSQPATVRQVVFEKSANYFDNEIAAQRAHALLPNARILVLLVDPVRRAYSWYQHMKYNRDKTAMSHTFQEIISANETSSKEVQNLCARCLKPGFFAQHMERWLSFYSKQQIVIVDGEQLSLNPVPVMLNLQQRLKLKPTIDFRRRLKYNRIKGFFCVLNSRSRSNCLGKGKGRRYEPMEEESRAWLQKFYSTHNQALFRLLTRLGIPIPGWLITVLASVKGIG